MTRTELAAFPLQLDVVARKIENINENMHLEASDKLLPTVHQLPLHLRQYATFLEHNVRRCPPPRGLNADLQ